MPTLSAPQDIFLNGLKTKYRAYVGGFGSGKTFVGCVDLLTFFGKHPGTVQGYFGISYPSMRDIFYPTFEEAAHMMGFTVVIREANKEAHVYRNGFYYGTVICRSMTALRTALVLRLRQRVFYSSILSSRKNQLNLILWCRHQRMRMQSTYPMITLIR